MKLGNSGGRNLGKKYLKIRGDEVITPDNRLKADAFNKWFSDNYLFLKKKITSQMSVTGVDEEVFHETYLKIATKILYGGLEIKDYALYFHRSYYTNVIQLSIKDARYTIYDLSNVDIIDESGYDIELQNKQEKAVQEILFFVKDNYPEDYDIFYLNKVKGAFQKDIALKYGVCFGNIRWRINVIKKHIVNEFPYLLNRRTEK